VATQAERREYEQWRRECEAVAWMCVSALCVSALQFSP